MGEEGVTDQIHEIWVEMRDSAKLIKNLLGKTIVNFDDFVSRKSQYSKYNNGESLDTFQRELITKAILEAHFHPLKDLRPTQKKLKSLDEEYEAL